MLAMPVSLIQKYLYTIPQLEKPLYSTSLDQGVILHHTLPKKVQGAGCAQTWELWWKYQQAFCGDNRADGELTSSKPLSWAATLAYIGQYSCKSPKEEIKMTEWLVPT